MTDSYADSENYKYLNLELENFMKYYNNEKQRKEAEVVTRVVGRSKSVPELEPIQSEYLLGGKEPIVNPAEHFLQIKTKINLKVTKLYHEHVERTKSEEKKALEPVIEVKDKFGRVMEKVNPLM